jgi:hypothetical protein
MGLDTAQAGDAGGIVARGWGGAGLVRFRLGRGRAGGGYEREKERRAGRGIEGEPQWDARRRE